MPISRPKLLALQVLVAVAVLAFWHVMTHWPLFGDVRTMRFFAERMKLVVEPTGCLAAAALLEGVVPARGQRVGVVVSGGNVDLARYAALLSGGPAAAG